MSKSKPSIDFGALIPAEQKIQLLESRIAQFAAEAYQHTLNKQTAELTGSTEQADSAQASIDILEAAIKVHFTELEAVRSTLPVETQDEE